MSTGFESLEFQARDGKRVKKGKVLRAEGLIPGVIFGGEMDSLNVQVPANEWKRFSLKNQVIFNAKVEGGKTHLVALKQVDRDNLGKITHLNLHKMKKGQKAVVMIPVNLIGEKHKDNKGIIYHNIEELQVEAIPSEVPDSIEIDISNMMEGDTIQIKDLTIAKGVEIQGFEPEDSVVDCRVNVVKEEAVAETADGEEASAEAAASGETGTAEAKEE